VNLTEKCPAEDSARRPRQKPSGNSGSARHRPFGFHIAEELVARTGLLGDIVKLSRQEGFPSSFQRGECDGKVLIFRSVSDDRPALLTKNRQPDKALIKDNDIIVKSISYMSSRPTSRPLGKFYRFRWFHRDVEFQNRFIPIAIRTRSDVRATASFSLSCVQVFATVL
jgi:hypothetical protein